MSTSNLLQNRSDGLEILPIIFFPFLTRDRCTNDTNPPRTHVLSATGTGYLCLSFVLGPTNPCLSCTSILRLISVNRPRCTASTRQTNERYPKATANVPIDVFKCPASTNQHRSMGRQGFFGPNARKDSPSLRTVGQCAACVVVPPPSRFYEKLTSTISPTLNLDSFLALADRRRRKLILVLLLLLVSLTRPERVLVLQQVVGNFSRQCAWERPVESQILPDF